jgi:DNA-binding CsgD family transcriptional regulator
VLAGRGRIDLTAREWEVVELLMRNATTSEMADTLGVAPVTIRRHLGSVERKLGVLTRAEIVELLKEEETLPAPV